MRKYKKTKKMDDGFSAAIMSAFIAAIPAFFVFLLGVEIGISIMLFLLVFVFCFLWINEVYSFLKGHNKKNGKNKKQ